MKVRRDAAYRRKKELSKILLENAAVKAPWRVICQTRFSPPGSFSGSHYYRKCATDPPMQKGGVERTEQSARAAYIARSTSCHADRNRFTVIARASLSGALRAVILLVIGVHTLTRQKRSISGYLTPIKST